MSYHFKKMVLLVTCIMSSILVSFSQIDVASKHKIIRAIQEKREKCGSHWKKYGNVLINKIIIAQDTTIHADNALLKSSSKRIKMTSYLTVRITLNRGEEKYLTDVESQIISLGGKITYKGKGGNNASAKIVCILQLDKIQTIAKDLHVAFIEECDSYKTQNEIISDGDSQLKADAVRTTYNVKGNGVKIGVISDNATHYLTANSYDELPYVNIRKYGEPGDNEGTAMLEIIYDLAPDASLFFSGITKSESYEVMSDILDEFIYQQCTICVDDITWYDEPYFSDETEFGDAIRTFLNKGGVYISSAGNENNSAQFYSGTTNFNSDDKNIFPDGKTYLDIEVASNESDQQSNYIYLQWATSWNNPTIDYDFFIYPLGIDPDGSLYTDYYPGMNIQSTSVPPIEKTGIMDNNSGATRKYQIEISRNYSTGPQQGTEFKIYCSGNCKINVSNSDNKTIVGHSAYPNVISVGAYQSDDLSKIASYSSHGPSKMFSNQTSTWTTQYTPTIVATSKVHTFVGSKGYWKYSDGSNVDPFSGTSASAPHIAAIAGLYFSKYPTRTREDFVNDLTMTANSIENKGGNGNWDDMAGYGKANALACIDRAASTVIAPTINPPSGPFSGPLDVEITSSTPNVEIRYTIDGTEPNQVTSNSYSQSFQVTPPCTVKAKAFSTTLQPSNISTVVYTVGSSNYWAWINGSVSTPSGERINGVRMDDGIGSPVYTRSDGTYAIPYRGREVNVYPSKEGYLFFPNTYPLYDRIPRDGNYWGQDYIGYNIVISGRIVDQSGVGLGNVQVNFHPIQGMNESTYPDYFSRSVVTDDFGYYSINVYGCSYLVTPELEGYLFNPRYRQTGEWDQSIVNGERIYECVHCLDDHLNQDFVGNKRLTVSGIVTYANNSTLQNVVGNTLVSIINSARTITTTSQLDGTYMFSRIYAGIDTEIYTITASKTGNWGGVDATDALLVQKHWLGISTLTDLKLAAGDVNGDNRVTNTDALLIIRRPQGYDNSFTIGDWIFDNKQVTVGTANVTANISGLAAGDVNASYDPGSGGVFLKGAVVVLKDGVDEFKLSSFSPGTYGAVSIWINVKSAKVAGITSKLPGFTSRISDEGVSLLWFAEDGKTPVEFKSNEAIVTVKLEGKTGSESSIEIRSNLADIRGEEVKNTLMLSYQENIPLSFELKQNYPNPFNPSTQIDYDLPMPGMVTLTVYNMLGQEVARLVNEQKEAGSYSVHWLPKNLASGMYVYRIRIQTEKETITSVKRLMLLK